MVDDFETTDYIGRSAYITTLEGEEIADILMVNIMIALKWIY